MSFNIDTFVQAATKTPLNKIINAAATAALNGAAKNINSIANGLASDLSHIGASFSSIQALTSLKVDSSFGDFSALAGSIANTGISALRNLTGLSSSNYATSISPEGKTKAFDVQNTSTAVTPVGDIGKYYMSIRFADYSRPAPFVSAKFDTKYTIHLPMPNNLADMTGVDYDTANLGTIGSLANAQQGEYTGRGTEAQALLLNAQSIGSAAGGIVGQLTRGKGLAGGLAGGLIGHALVNDNIITALEQSLGVAPNPNQSVAFKGPRLRDGGFSWIFSPRSIEESQAIKDLIYQLKGRMLPTTTYGKDAGLLNYPQMCLFNFYPWDSNSASGNDYGWGKDSIIRYKRCVLTSVNANYSPSGTPSFFRGTNLPTLISLSISFKEIEFFLATDWGRTAETVGNSKIDSIITDANKSFKGVGDALDRAFS